MPYFGEPVGRVKIQTTSKNSQRYYTTKCLIRDLLSNTPNYYVRGGEPPRILIYGGMRDRHMRSGTKLARGIQLTDWSTAGNLSNRSSGVQIPRDICTRCGRYLYSTKCSWIINAFIALFVFLRDLNSISMMRLCAPPLSCKKKKNVYTFVTRALTGSLSYFLLRLGRLGC